MTGSVLVVGGGIAGRAAARALAKHGLGCTVVEQRESSGRGTGVNLPGNAVRALAELGVPEQALSEGLPLRRREYRNRRGHLLFTMDEDSFWAGVGRSTCIRHGDLVDALALPEAAALERARAVRARPTSEGVEILVEGISSPRFFDFVIGADGVHSSMREAVAQDVLRPSSMTRSAWRFVGDNPGVDCWTAWSGRDVTFLLIPMTEDLVYGYAARTRGGHVGSHRSWLAQEAEGFPAVVGAAVAQGMRSGELHHAAVDEVRLGTWHRGRLVLIGDAAHATGPVWAQGVAMALEDALALGRLLTSTPADDWGRVGPRFEALRRPRVGHVQSATDRMSRLAALPGWLRDVSATALGPKSYRAAYEPLLGPDHLNDRDG
ncbi:putative Monooxygenase, FAD-binding [metagenome]|uniref:Putative Monooxygenase, FAD-binding n=1 Tax=metagenome TaxID=256318 RepID=A0A2P2C9M1_9ZZZZ